MIRPQFILMSVLGTPLAWTAYLIGRDNTLSLVCTIGATYAAVMALLASDRKAAHK